MAVTKIRGNQIQDVSISNLQIATDAAIATSKLADGANFIRNDVIPVFTVDVNLNGNTIINLEDPVNPQDAATKAYVDGVAQGLDFKESVRVATTGVSLDATYSNVTKTLTANNNESLIIDTVTLALNERVLVKDQSAQYANGIYIVTVVGNGSTPWVLTRSQDANSDSEVTSGMYTYIEEGPINQTTSWVLTTSNPIVLGTTNLQFAQFGGGGTYVAGDGITQSGNIFNVGAGNGILVAADNVAVKADVTGGANLAKAIHVSANGVAVKVDDSSIEGDSTSGQLKVKDGGITSTKLAINSVTAEKIASDVAGSGLTLNGTTNALDVNTDNLTLEVNVDTLRIKDLGVTSGKIAANAVTAAKLNNDVAGNGIVLNGTTNALDINTDNSTLEINADILRIKDLGVTAAKLADGAVTAIKLNANVAGDGIVLNGTTNALDVNTDNSTLEISSDQVRVKAAGITSTHLANNSVTTNAITDLNVTTNKINSNAVTAAKLNVDVAGLGIVLNGTTNAIDVNVDNLTLEINTDQVRVKALGITSTHLAVDSVYTNAIQNLAVTAGKIAANAITAVKLNSDVAGSGLVLNGVSNALDINVDNSTLEVNADILRIKDLGVTTGKLNNNAVTAIKLNSDVAGNGVSLNITTNAIDVNVDNTTIEINTDSLRLKDGGITNVKIASNAAISLSKLEASSTSAQIIVSNGSNVPTYVSMSGDATIATTGVITANASTVVKVSGRYTETFAGNNSTVDFTVGNALLDTDWVDVYLNGILQNSGAANDYTVNLGLNRITFNDAPKNNDVVVIKYYSAA